MDPHKYDTIFHAEHDLFCPISRARLEAVIEMVSLPNGAHILDCQAGKGELFVRLLERFGATGVAWEAGSTFFQVLRSEVLSRLEPGRAEVVEGEVWQAEFENESFDLIISIGPAPFGDLETSLQRLWAMVKSGGMVLLGLWHWVDGDPDPDYLDILGCGPDAHPTHEAVFEMAQREDFTPLYAITAGRDDMDHYEGTGLWAAERWLRGNPGDPDKVAIRERLHALRDAWVRWGRFELGFGLYLLLK
jgi:ubiquinone/menaquinone biosynthesis C-methylase UbiE